MLEVVIWDVEEPCLFSLSREVAVCACLVCGLGLIERPFPPDGQTWGSKYDFRGAAATKEKYSIPKTGTDPLGSDMAVRGGCSEYARENAKIQSGWGAALVDCVSCRRSMAYQLLGTAVGCWKGSENNVIRRKHPFCSDSSSFARVMILLR